MCLTNLVECRIVYWMNNFVISLSKQEYEIILWVLNTEVDWILGTWVIFDSWCDRKPSVSNFDYYINSLPNRLFMLYNSFQFLWLLPLILVAYYFLPILFVPLKISKTIVANRLLLIVSYALYMQWNPAYALILLGITAETYLFALWIGNTVGQWRRKFLLISCGIGLALLPLLVFKYYNFITSSFASLFGWGELPGLNWAIPVGISFLLFRL